MRKINPTQGWLISGTAPDHKAGPGTHCESCHSGPQDPLKATPPPSSNKWLGNGSQGREVSETDNQL